MSVRTWQAQWPAALPRGPGLQASAAWRSALARLAHAERDADEDCDEPASSEDLDRDVELRNFLEGHAKGNEQQKGAENSCQGRGSVHRSGVLLPDLFGVLF